MSIVHMDKAEHIKTRLPHRAFHFILKIEHIQNMNNDMSIATTIYLL